jgi:hypothetical protein
MQETATSILIDLGVCLRIVVFCSKSNEFERQPHVSVKDNSVADGGAS